MCTSKTQEAKELYNNLLKDCPGLKVGLWFNLEHEWIWVAKGERAYPVKELSDGHLKNLVKAMRERHPDELRGPLEEELNRRMTEPDTPTLKKVKRSIQVNDTLIDVNGYKIRVVDVLPNSIIGQVSRPNGTLFDNLTIIEKVIANGFGRLEK